MTTSADHLLHLNMKLAGKHRQCRLVRDKPRKVYLIAAIIVQARALTKSVLQALFDDGFQFLASQHQQAYVFCRP